MFENPSHVKNKAQDSILITGSARSGTSIFGKLVGSLDAAEYFFEPSLLVALFAVLDDLDEPHARFLFENYTYEDLLVGSLSGRSMNMRKQDDSSIYHTKTPDEIERRLKKSARKKDLDTSSSTCIIKLPNFVYKLQSISKIINLKYYLISIRDPSSTINSLMAKDWFSDSTLQACDIMSPNNYSIDIPAPHWVPKHYLSEWSSMSDVDRSALYYITQTKILEMPEYSLVFDYDQFLANPRKLIECVSSKLDLSFGPNTETIIKQVKIQDTYSKFDMKKVRQEFRELALSVYEYSRKLCIRL